MHIDPRSYAEPTSPRLLLGWASVICLGLAAASIGFDVHASDSLRQWDIPGDLAKAIELSEAFAHGSGAACILILIYSISIRHRQSVLLAVLITLGSGLLANGLKATVVRIRPYARDLVTVASSQNTHEASNSTAGNLQVVESSFWDSRQRSFPSGHAATAWGLAIGLALAYPRGTLGFLFLATLASLQRITCGAHYPSDVFAGAALACCVAYGSVVFSSNVKFWRTSLRLANRRN